MTIWDLCIKRPVFTAMLVSAPILLGLVCYGRLGVELFPNVDLPIVTVTTTLRGASVEEMETGVTKQIEETVNTVSGIDELRSTTKEGFSQVVIQFKLEKNGAVAAQEVDAKVRTILSRFPQGTDPPIIDKLAIDAAPVMTIAVSGRRDFREVTEIARKRIKEDLETISGVGSVVLVGGRQRAINVIIDPDKLLKYENLTVEDVRQALIRENQEQPGGRVDRGQSELVLRTLGRVERPGDFARLIVGNRNGQPIRIEDVGRVEDSYEEPRGLSRLWVKGDAEAGDDATWARMPSASSSRSSRAATRSRWSTLVKDRLAQILPTLPDDIKAEVIRDQSRFINNSMEEVKTHLLPGGVLVSALRSCCSCATGGPRSSPRWRSRPRWWARSRSCTLMGFTLNNFTMIGLILAVGIVVDDAVVVHENIFPPHGGVRAAAPAKRPAGRRAKSPWPCSRRRSRWS